MRFLSTPKSAAALEISIMAIIETIVAVFSSLYLAIFVFDSFMHIIVACCIAPLLLLRTNESTLLGIESFVSKLDFWSRTSDKYWYISLIIFPLIPVWVKISTTLRSVLSKPSKSFLATPTNFFRICMCMDFAHVPELVPGLETSEILPDVRFGYLINEIKDSQFYDFRDYIELALLLMMFIPAFIIAYLYRYSVKATAIVWLPLLLVIPKLNPSKKFITRVELVNKSSWGKFIFWLSLVVLLLFVGKLAIYHELVVILENGNLLFQSVFNNFVAPKTIPWWQIASVVNSVLAIVLFFITGNVLFYIKNNESLSLKVCDNFFRAITAIRLLLSIYTSLCLLYTLFSLVSIIELPPLGEKLFPWQ